MEFQKDSIKSECGNARLLRSAIRWVLPAFLTQASNLMAAESASSPASNPDFSLIKFLGPFHILVLHFPIGLVAMAALMELWITWTRQASWRPALQLILAATVGAALITVPLGLARAEGGEFSADLVGQHRLGGILVALFALAGCITHAKTVRSGDAASGLALFRGLLAITLGLVFYTGHTGGSLTHGSEFLTANAPSFMRPAGKPAPVKAAAGTSAAESSGLPKQARAVFEKKCFACHGAEKKKGGLRLDDPSLHATPGESKSVPIRGGDPGGSEVVRRILLNRDNDEAMPPSGKEPLSDQEFSVVAKWIQSGAVPW